METPAAPSTDIRAFFNALRKHPRASAAAGVSALVLAAVGYSFHAADQKIKHGAVTGIANSLMSIKAADYSSQDLNRQANIPFQNPVNKEWGHFLVMGDLPAKTGQRCFSVDAQRGGVHGDGEKPKLDKAGRPAYYSEILKVCIPAARP